MKFLFLPFILLSFSLSASANINMPEDMLLQKAKAFIAAKNARQQPETTEADIDHFIAFLADDFVDEHIKFGVTVTDKAELKRGMVAKLEDKIFFSEINIDQIMTGRNVVFVKFTERAKVKPSHMDRAIEYESSNIMSLEFDEGGLIKHIRRHHS